MAEASSGYNEKYFENYASLLADGSRIFNTRLYGTDTLGTVSAVNVTLDNKLTVMSQPYLYSLTEGNIVDHTPVRRFGINNAVRTDYETIDRSAVPYPYLTSAEQLEISSSSALDDISSTGMQSIFIQGLDTNYVLQNEIVELEGLTKVYTTKSYLRLLAAYGEAVGTSGYNVGNINIANNAGTSTKGYIPIAEGRWNSAIFTVPAGYTFYMTSWTGSENSSKGANMSMWKKEFGNGGWQIIRAMNLLDDHFQWNLEVPLNFSEKSDIEIRGKSVLGNARVTAGFTGWMELN